MPTTPTALDLIPHAVLAVNDQLIVVGANDDARLLLGRAAGELIGATLGDLGDATLSARVRDTQATGDPAPLAAELRGADGPVPVEIRVGTAAPGADPRTLITLRDLRPQRRELSSLRQSQAALQAILDNEPECVKQVDADHRLLDMNPAGLRLIAAESMDAVRGVDVRDLLLPQYHERFEAGVAAVFRGEHSFQVFEIEALDGTRRWMEQHSAPLWDPDDPTRVKHMLAVTRDITQRKRDEMELLRKQRIEAIGSLAGGIAHDINNVLAPIALSLHELRDAAEPEQAEDIDALQNGIRHAADMLRQLLTFARGVDGQRIPVDPASVIEELTQMLSSTFPKSVRIQRQATRTRWVIADPTQLHQVLLNLCLNARDAMPQGGRLSVRAEDATVLAPSGVGADACEPGDYVVLHVEDDGDGIQEDALPSIFDPFYTSKGPDLGTGLGLSSSLGIVRSHGGFLQVRSAPGEGTRFSVFLPANNGASSDAPIPGAPTRADLHRHDGARVLLVEDDPTVRRVTARLLRAEGLDVLAAEDGMAALDLLATQPGGIALLLTDLHMPRMDGIDLARRLRGARPALPVVVATGRLDETAVRRMVDLQPVITLEKPFGAGALRDALARALDEARSGG